MNRTVHIALATLLLTATGTTGCSSTPPLRSAPETHRAERNVVTKAEIREGMESAYDVVANTRPLWLMPRGYLPSDNGRPETPTVYVDGFRYGSCESLRSIQAIDVTEIRFLDSKSATTRFGSGHTNGAILVSLRRR
jgi:hypothetical protein